MGSSKKRRALGSASFTRLIMLISALGVSMTAPEAAEIALAGVIGHHAVLVVDGGSPQTLRVGALSREGVRLIGLTGDQAVVEFQGERQRLRLGESVVNTPGTSAPARLELVADGQGHFWAQGRINGSTVRFLIDTGASMIALGRSDALRLGLDYTTGERAATVTANGTVSTWRVRLDTVDVGGMRLHNVDAMIHDRDLPIALLGMSVLNRMRWQRDGQKLILEKRY